MSRSHPARHRIVYILIALSRTIRTSMGIIIEVDNVYDVSGGLNVHGMFGSVATTKVEGILREKGIKIKKKLLPTKKSIINTLFEVE